MSTQSFLEANFLAKKEETPCNQRKLISHKEDGLIFTKEQQQPVRFLCDLPQFNCRSRITSGPKASKRPWIRSPWKTSLRRRRVGTRPRKNRPTRWHSVRLQLQRSKCVFGQKGALAEPPDLRGFGASFSEQRVFST